MLPCAPRHGAAGAEAATSARLCSCLHDFWLGPMKLPGSCQVSLAGVGTEGHVEVAAALELPLCCSHHPTGNPLRAGAWLAAASGLAHFSVLVPKVSLPPRKLAPFALRCRMMFSQDR